MAGRLLVAAALSLALLQGAAQAQSDTTPSAWTLLNAPQRTALAPLSRDWDDMSDTHRQKWIGIARRYAKLSPIEQARLQDRMREWIALTPAQRQYVRSQYTNLRTTPEQKNELGRKWQEYAALPNEEKERLAKEASQNTVIATAPAHPIGGLSSMSRYKTPTPKYLSRTPPNAKSRPLASVAVPPANPNSPR